MKTAAVVCILAILVLPSIIIVTGDTMEQWQKGELWDENEDRMNVGNRIEGGIDDNDPTENGNVPNTKTRPLGPVRDWDRIPGYVGGIGGPGVGEVRMENLEQVRTDNQEQMKTDNHQQVRMENRWSMSGEPGGAHSS